VYLHEVLGGDEWGTTRLLRRRKRRYRRPEDVSSNLALEHFFGFYLYYLIVIY
jgi:hypothetical protein